MTLNSLEAEVKRLAADQGLVDEAALGARANALDALSFLVGRIHAYLRSHRLDAQSEHLLHQTIELWTHLTAIDQRFFERYRDLIRTKAISPSDLRRLFDRYTRYRPDHDGYRHLGFEPLDTLVAGLLFHAQPPDPVPLDSPEMVPYQPTPASVVLEVVDRLALSPADVFCDVGAGLGLVVHLVGLLAGCRAYGVEVDADLCAYAGAVTTDLKLSNVSFVNADAREADLGDATVYYLFTPFIGELRDTVLARLQDQVARRRIRICSYGPITPHLAKVPWLASLNDHGEDEFRLAVFDGRQSEASERVWPGPLGESRLRSTDRKPRQLGTGEGEMDYDRDRVDDMTLALLYLVMWKDRDGDRRAWKGFDWDTMDRLYEKGWIGDPKSKAKSVWISDEGAERARALFEAHFGITEETE